MLLKKRVIEEITTYLQDEMKEPQITVERREELNRLLLMYRFLPHREYEKDECVIPSALVELQLGQARAYYFVAPQGGGLVTRVDGVPVQVITPNSPLGEAILGKKVGEKIQVESRGKVREYQVMAIS